jgi:MFS family permease
LCLFKRVAVGADYPISTSLLAEFSPRRLRAKMLGLVSCAFYAGATVAGVAGYFMLNLGPSRWQWMLGSSAFLALILVLERWRTPESQKAYDHYYHLIEGKSVPLQLIETIRKRYNHRSNHSPTFEEFMNNTTRFLQRF